MTNGVDVCTSELAATVVMSFVPGTFAELARVVMVVVLPVTSTIEAVDCPAFTLTE